MSPHLIVILMLSSCTLLVMLMFAVRKRARKNSNPTSLSQTSNPMPNLSSLDFSDLKNFSPTIPQQPTSNEQSSDLIEMVSRYRFFQGKNLELFKRLIEENNWNQIEQLIQEKFQAQEKNEPSQLAQEVIWKLQTATNT